jgi:hypothetical protein
MNKKLIVFCIFALLFPLFTLASPPKKVIVKYKKETKTISVKAIHPVKNSTTHYIESFVISVNGTVVKTVEVKSQSSSKEEDIEIEMPDLKPGDEVKVVATCNKFGSKAGKIKI